MAEDLNRVKKQERPFRVHWDFLQS